VNAPEGWSDAVATWMKIWEGTNRELQRNPDSARATIVNLTSYRHLRALMAQRPCETNR
jgi:hypothetical protein